ncbi:hypothetical protein E0493_20620 [Roseomonas sp. M0104]|uniref:Uncharacterized protein n=1 Tax=Teichococcus coralli TaxID=2545983 RepID=A0A845BFV6_9PROT|nr:hypothetical protein [Pseudoroseomonas coralli]MXP65758.1 hypothetical protein [Pseudoroseomonas coralli]
MQRRAIVVGLFLATAGCAAPLPPLRLPPAATGQFRDPLEAALRGAAAAFASPSSLRGQPARAALAVAQLEFLAVEIPAGRSSREFGSLVAPGLQAARYEVRGTLGIPSDAPPQAVIDALTAAAAAADPESRLPATLFPAGGAGTWRQLGSLPRLPQANAATQRALRQWEFGPPQELIDTAD